MTLLGCTLVARLTVVWPLNAHGIVKQYGAELKIICRRAIELPVRAVKVLMSQLVLTAPLQISEATAVTASWITLGVDGSVLFTRCATVPGGSAEPGGEGAAREKTHPGQVGVIDQIIDTDAMSAWRVLQR